MLLLNQSEIAKLSCTQEELSAKFLQQLAKDFNEIGCGVFFEKITVPLHYEVLITEINEALFAIKKQGSNLHQQLLYRVDISEKQVAEMFLREDNKNALAELIIKRILQKVILKIQFSKK